MRMVLKSQRGDCSCQHAHSNTPLFLPPTRSHLVVSQPPNDAAEGQQALMDVAGLCKQAKGCACG